MWSTVREERGQAMLETGIALLVIIMVSAGVIDAARGFYQYNVVDAAARYGARWGSIAGGLCATANGPSTNDWCDQLGTSATAFWSQPGNAPLQASGVSCPSSFDSTFTGYYIASNYLRGTATTIVGSVAQRFETSSASTSYVQGALEPGLVMSNLKVCIQLTWNSTLSEWSTQPGDKVGVYIYYPYQPSVSLLTIVKQVNLVASSEYRID